MAIDEKLLKSVIAEVLKEMNTADTSAASAVEGETYECPGMQITEIGDAEKGTNPNEVVLGLAPAFGESQTTNIVGIPHADIVKRLWLVWKKKVFPVESLKFTEHPMYLSSLMMLLNYQVQASELEFSPKVLL